MNIHKNDWILQKYVIFKDLGQEGKEHGIIKLKEIGLGCDKGILNVRKSRLWS